MSAETKIHLSKLEIELVNNKEWILTKQSIINKVYDLFGELHEIYKGIAQQERAFLPEFYVNTGGKISKGENYEGLPYVMLDYPAIFSREDILAVRTMFWWGNFFSITLHVSGERYKVKGDLSLLLAYLRENKFFICVNDREWQHNFEDSNYLAAKECDVKKLEQMANKNFFKISKNVGLNKWDDTPEFLEKSFREIIYIIGISFRDGEKALSPGFPKAGSGL
jgi:hypothetical protein